MTVAEEANGMGLGQADILEMESDSTIRGIIELCDPRTDLNSESEFIMFWLKARSAIDLFISLHAHTLTPTHDKLGGQL